MRLRRKEDWRDEYCPECGCRVLKECSVCACGYRFISKSKEVIYK